MSLILYLCREFWVPAVIATAQNNNNKYLGYIALGLCD